MILIYSNYKKRKDIIIMKKRLISFMLLITVISCVGFNTDYFKNLLTLISQAAKEVIYEETERYDEETTDSAVDRLEQEMEKLDVRNFFEEESETESGSKTYKNSSDITKDIRQNKPLNSPAIDAWYGKNGTISIDENGVCTYHDWEGNSVSYPNGYPDFKSAGMVRQEAPIGPFVERNKDFAKAREMGYIKSADGTWHHHEDGVTLQEVETILHDRFRHRGVEYQT